jgi:putative phosphoesterase
MKIGVISDTHNYLDPKIHEIFAGVEHIFHAGDVGMPAVILELEDIAPVTAVSGNVDEGNDYRDTEVVEFEGLKFLLHHIVDPHDLEDKIKRRITKEKPDVVIFGHTHRPFNEKIDTTLYFNPGYAGKQRFNQARSVAILYCEAKEIRVEFREL